MRSGISRQTRKWAWSLMGAMHQQMRAAIAKGETRKRCCSFRSALQTHLQGTIRAKCAMMQED
ncbi:hypothetical protein BJF93_14730 [Xaviernesmea oryzae]|uniref:Uncharacterized protein n=1 Tax=Xaviernesmea oryzae TaxID=464029 RepID=A0A1Q9AXR1_9HYPH|nr:hypothetical protein BJF93_14730 [Xaviernesmea oryzae]